MYTWTSPDGKTHNKFYHILIKRRWHSSILDVRIFRGVVSLTDHCLVIAKFWEILAVSKVAAQKFYRERFNLRELNELEVGKQYQIEISNRFTALENLSVGEDKYRAWENIKENIKITTKESLVLYEFKQHMP